MLRPLGVAQGLQERGAGGGLVRLPQVEVGIEVEDAQAPVRALLGEPQIASPRGLVPAAEHPSQSFGQPGGAPQLGDLPGEVRLPGLEVLTRDDDVARVRPKVFWGRGQEDPIISEPRVEETHAWLNAHVDLMKIVYAGLGHAINEQELGHVKEYLAHMVPPRG